MTDLDAISPLIKQDPFLLKQYLVDEGDEYVYEGRKRYDLYSWFQHELYKRRNDHQDALESWIRHMISILSGHTSFHMNRFDIHTSISIMKCISFLSLEEKKKLLPMFPIDDLIDYIFITGPTKRTQDIVNMLLACDILWDRVEDLLKKRFTIPIEVVDVVIDELDSCIHQDNDHPFLLFPTHYVEWKQQHNIRIPPRTKEYSTLSYRDIVSIGNIILSKYKQGSNTRLCKRYAVYVGYEYVYGEQSSCHHTCQAKRYTSIEHKLRILASLGLFRTHRSFDRHLSLMNMLSCM